MTIVSDHRSLIVTTRPAAGIDRPPRSSPSRDAPAGARALTVAAASMFVSGAAMAQGGGMMGGSWGGGWMGGYGGAWMPILLLAVVVAIAVMVIRRK